MIILGDIAVPSKDLANNLKQTFIDNSEIFSEQNVILNLEGMVTDQQSCDTDTPILFNHSSLLNILQKCTDGSVATLANNHTLDLPEQFDYTLGLLRSSGIPYAGAGRSVLEAEAPATFIEDGKKSFVFNYCWEFLLYHQQNPTNGVYVSEISVQKIIDKISNYRLNNLDSNIIVYFHWSIDLEILPYPMYRTFSRALIDAGANVVAGCHSHCVQGGEVYKDGYIVYGLGNFFIPWNEYVNGRLTFPDFSKITLALEWNSISNNATCHWFRYNEEEKSLAKIKTEPFKESLLLTEYSAFQGMSDKAYISFFKINRRKSFLIPVFKDHRNIVKNKFLTILLKFRARIARKLAKLKIVKWQN